VPSLNLGILAHVDAGKTSLTERLLHSAGVIDEVGSVDAGSTQTDSMALERQRGITIRSAVVSFVIDGVTVNLIDTPGHPDFIAEVERVLSVLDGAVLVVSAVEGVQAQTRVLMRTLRRLRIPTLIFVNKTDRRGADPERVFREITTRLAPAVKADLSDALETLAEHDDALLAAYVNGTAVPTEQLRQTLATHTRDVHPVFFGSAITGAGTTDLMAGLTSLLPTMSEGDGPPAGTVFKVERGPAGEKIAYVRMFDGTLHLRDRLPAGKITAISVFGAGTATEVGAGRIAKLWGLTGIQVGDTIGAPDTTTQHHFAPPTLETVIEPLQQSDKGTLHAALTQLAEQDPLINLRQDGDEISVSLYGEVQKEVIEATLADEYGIAVGFRESTTIHIERPVGVGAAAEFIGRNPFLATVGLRVEPGPVGSGVRFELEVELGSMPYAFFVAVEETVHATLAQGLAGWSVTDVVVTMTHSGYWARQSHSHGTFDKSMSSTAGDFRNLTPLVLMAALTQAGTRVYEPMHRFRLEIPEEAYNTVLPVLVRHRAVPLSSMISGATYVVTGDIPAERVHALSQRLPHLTRGEGVVESTFDHYQALTGAFPIRPRSDHNPLNRKEYLLHVVRRV
jgi:ribosomal protection tetracycline resistance protein